MYATVSSPPLYCIVAALCGPRVGARPPSAAAPLRRVRTREPAGRERPLSSTDPHASFVRADGPPRLVRVSRCSLGGKVFEKIHPCGNSIFGLKLLPLRSMVRIIANAANVSTTIVASSAVHAVGFDAEEQSPKLLPLRSRLRSEGYV